MYANMPQKTQLQKAYFDYKWTARNEKKTKKEQNETVK